MIMRQRSLQLLFIVCTFGAFCANAQPNATAQTKKIPLASVNSANPTEELKFNLPVSGYPLSLPLTFVRAGTDEPPKEVTLTLEVFSGPQNEPYFIAFDNQQGPNDNCTRGSIPYPVNVPLADGSPILLRTMITVYCNPATPGPYTGRLIVTAAGYQPLIFKITLTKAAIKPAALTLSRRDGTILLSRSVCDHLSSLSGERLSWCRWEGKSQPQVSTSAWDKNGLSPITGLSARLEQLSTTSNHNLDTGQNLTFFLDSKESPRFDSTPDPNDASRELAAGGQKSIGIGAHDLLPGEYHATLRFFGSNSIDDDSQKFNLVVIVRDSWVMALLVLILALLLSFAANKLIKSKQAQLELEKRIRDMTPVWLSSEEPVLPVVWIQAALRQVEDLAGRFWLTGQSVLTARLDQTQKIIRIWTNVRELRNKIGDAQIPRFMETHVRALLNKIIGQIGPDSTDEAKTAQIQTQLDNLLAWTDTQKVNDCYWKDVFAIGTALLAEIDVQAVPEASRTVFTGLRDDVKKTLDAGQPQGADAVKILGQLDMDLAKLKILWIRRSSTEDFNKLASLLHSTSNEVFLQTSDDLSWKFIKSTGLEIVMPDVNGPDPTQTFTPINAHIKTKDPGMDESFFFHHKLSFNWQFLLAERKSGRRILRLTPETVGPRIMQYMPKPGTLTVSVSVRQKSAPAEKPMQPAADPIEVRKSGDFGYFTGLERMEIYSTLVAAVIAIISGLGTFYFKNAAWGSFQDYLTLFVWGAGIDQSKNFLQNLQGLSAGK
jgi:hypothetical protein